jgi:cysteinyl-tRNA synthetase
MMDRAMDFEEDVCNPDKKNHLDITLWKASSKNQHKHIPSFKSPWSDGRPGWHIECSAMSISSLGEQIDIHGGGIDLIFPHHEAEIAQSEGATNKIPFAKFWIHSQLVAYKGLKMSKSDKNLVMISQVLKKNTANAIRFVLLSHHYRKPWEFFQKELDNAEKTFSNIAKQVDGVKVTKNDFKNPEIIKFREIIEDDLNTPKVIVFIEGIAAQIKNEKNNLKKNKLQESLIVILRVLGFII